MEKHNSYLDGIALFYAKKEPVKNIRTLDDLEYKYKLAFDLKTVRQSDMEFAMQNSKQLSLKIVTQDNGRMDTALNVVIDNVVYAIIYADKNKKKNELYFYLTEVRKFV